jgi:two-component system OmpR family response regulator
VPLWGSFCLPLTVLVVDDVADAADTLAVILSMCGFAARAVTSGRAALAAAAADPPDAVVIDLEMPGMDGWELARRLRAASADVRPLLIAVTGCCDEVSRRRSAEAGIDLHLLKPVEPAVLVGVLERFARVLAPHLSAAEGDSRG